MAEPDLRPAVDDLAAGSGMTTSQEHKEPAGDVAVARPLDQSPASNLSNGEPGQSAEAAPARVSFTQPVQQSAEQPPTTTPLAAPAGPPPEVVRVPWYKRLFGACCGKESTVVTAYQGAGEQGAMLVRQATTAAFGRTVTSPFAADHGGYQAPLGAGMPRRVSTFYTDADWFDAQSEFERTKSSMQPAEPTIAEGTEPPLDLQRVASEFQAMAGSQWAPDPPLDFAAPNTRYVRVPANTGVAGYWLTDPERTTPFPQPCDIMLGVSSLAIKAHASIPGILITENATEMRMAAKPALMGGMIDYNEHFTKDGKTTSWRMRRDLKAGRTFGQMYYTADGTVIWRVQAKGLWGHAVEWLAEDHMRMEEDGNILISRQCAKHVASGKTAVQYLVGRRISH